MRKREANNPFKTTHSQRLRTAKHEIGHAVVAMFYGGTFESIEVHSDRPLESGATNIEKCSLGHYISGVVRGLGHGLQDREYVVALMGGAAGTKVNRVQHGGFTLRDVFSGCESDWRLAVDVATPQHIGYFARRAKDVDQYLNECHAVAHQIIRRHKATHVALVEALLREGNLSFEKCKDFWDEQFTH
jgi:hypothetical protein